MTTRIEVALGSMKNSSARYVASGTAISERGDQLGMSALCGDVADRNGTFRGLNLLYET